MRLFLIVFYLFPVAVFGQLTGKVVAITDGDTFTLLANDNIQLKVRLYGIDCPEKTQDFGQVAKQFLSDLIYNKAVMVRQMDIDRYGRTIGMVMVDSINVNESLLKAGLAWHYKRYDNGTSWATMEELARTQQKGLWAKPNPVPPWDYRKLK